VSLRKHKPNNITITAQTSKSFWKSGSGVRSKMRPDIVVNKDKVECVVLDTKWKNLNGSNPSPEDLRQMFVYHEYYGAKKVALVYPGAESLQSGGAYLDPKTSNLLDKECGVIFLSVEPKIKQWQQNIYKYIDSWLITTENSK
jgi:5-methylcytosine-specific restriction enzyme subunit McrC